MDYKEGTEYVLTAPRCRPTWQEVVGSAVMNRSKRFKKGQVLSGIPDHLIARLVDMGHAVPKDEYDPAAMRKVSEARRLAMNQAAAADAKAAVDARAANSNGQPVVGLEDAPGSERRMSGEIPIDDVSDLKDADGNDDDDELTGVPDPATDGQPAEDYHNMQYSDLQQYAKKVTGSGAGSADDIKARLDEHFAQ